MPDPTKTIAFRVSQMVEDQIQEIAQSQGLSKGEWVRQQVMQAIHSLNPTSESDPAKSNTVGPVDLLPTLASLRQDIAAVKTAIAELATRHHHDLCAVAEVGMNVEQSIEQGLDTAYSEVLDAIAKIARLQKSETDRVLDTISDLISP
jgi:hypothetical protein